MQSVRVLLRNETAEKHAKIESVYSHLISPELSLEKYLCTLRQLHQFHKTIEDFFILSSSRRMASAVDFYCSERLKLIHIESDLRFFGESIPQEVLCLDVPNDNFEARAWGMIYVLEGSTLGAQVICRSLESCLGISKGKGADFFYGYGQETGKRWTQFLARLEQ